MLDSGSSLPVSCRQDVIGMRKDYRRGLWVGTQGSIETLCDRRMKNVPGPAILVAGVRMTVPVAAGSGYGNVAGMPGAAC
jgi:hypothetical protein